MPKFLLGEQEVNLDKKQVARQAVHLEPDPLRRLNHVVTINGKVFPIKQLIAKVMNLPPEAVTTLDAYRILTQLGYEVTFKR